jgi:uncharacterized membrane protein
MKKFKFRIKNRAPVDFAFDIAAFIKGFDGIVELVGGIMLIIIPYTTVKGFIDFLTLFELQSDDKNAFIAAGLTYLDKSINGNTQILVAIYLIGHGLLKVILSYALLKRYYHLYPLVIAALLVFIAYQSYLVGRERSLIIAGVTLFDCVIAGLTYIEYRRHQALPKLDKNT